jgi:hypothetical protein
MISRIGRACGLTCAAVAALWMTACGGGGGGGDSGGTTATLTVARSSLSFDVEQGETAAPQTVSGTLTNVTTPITVIIGYTTTGIANASFVSTSNSSGELTVTPRASADLAPGVYSDTIDVQACFDAQCTRQAAGSPQRVNVSYTVRRAAPAPALEASQRGIALASVPGGQRLSHSVIVREASGTATQWTATSSAGWLSVTPTGAVGASLALSADIALLAEGFHQATVTVRAANAAGVRDETLRVGLYKSSAAAATRLADPLLPSPSAPGAVQSVSDPVRPLAYFAHGETVAAQHFHSGARAGTITLPGQTVLQMAIDDDGRTLFVLHRPTFGLQLTTITRIDLDGFVVAGTLAPQNWQPSGSTTRAAFTRVAGRAVLVFNGGFDATGFNLLTPIVDAETGALVGRVTGYNGWDFTYYVAAGGGVVFAADKGITGGGLSTTRLQLRANSLGHVYNTVSSSAPASVATGLMDMAVRPDGGQAVLAYFGASAYQSAVFDGTALTQAAGGPPIAGSSAGDIEFLADGRYVAVTGDTLRLYAH